MVVDGLRRAVHLQRACGTSADARERGIVSGTRPVRRRRGGERSLTSLQDLGDAGVVGLQLHLELGQLLVQLAQVPVHLSTERQEGRLAAARNARFRKIPAGRTHQIINLIGQLHLLIGIFQSFVIILNTNTAWVGVTGRGQNPAPLTKPSSVPVHTRGRWE